MAARIAPLAATLALMLIVTLLTDPADARAGERWVDGSRQWRHEAGTLTLNAPPTRIVALNWAATEALLLLGITPVGVADRDGYGTWVQAPALPDAGVANVGSRSAPSLEAIAELKPDLIVTSAELAPAASQLEALAPTYVISLYTPGADPFERATRQLRTLADMTGRRARAERVLAELNATLDQERARLADAGLAGIPVALVNFLDTRHVRIYARNGLYQTVLDRLGLVNAWQAPGNFWGFSVTGLDALAATPDARLAVIAPTPPGLADSLAESPFWTYLPSVQKHRVYPVEATWPFGGVYPIQRLARALTDRLLAGGVDRVE